MFNGKLTTYLKSTFFLLLFLISMQMLVLWCWRAITLNRERFSQHETLPKLYSKSLMNRNHENFVVQLPADYREINLFAD